MAGLSFSNCFQVLPLEYAPKVFPWVGWEFEVGSDIEKKRCQSQPKKCRSPIDCSELQADEIDQANGMERMKKIEDGGQRLNSPTSGPKKEVKK